MDPITKAEKQSTLISVVRIRAFALILIAVCLVLAGKARAADELTPEHAAAAAPAAQAEPDSVWTVSPNAQGEVDWIGTLKGYAYTIGGLVAAWFAYDRVDVGDDNSRPGEISPAELAAAEQQAAAEALRTGPQVKQRYLISGTFSGPVMPGCANGAPFSITFGPAYSDTTGGNIAAAASQDVCGTVTDGLGAGAWVQISDGEIRIDGSFPAYRGVARILGGDLALANGVRLTGGTITLMPLER